MVLFYRYHSIIHFVMIAKLKDFKSNIYGFVWAYFKFWYWAGLGLVLSGCLAGFASQTWQPCHTHHSDTTTKTTHPIC